MGNLRDQFQKANLLSKKDAKRLAHEERVQRTEIGRSGLAAQEEARRAELAALQAEERDRRKLSQAELDAERRRGEERAACEQILTQDIVRPSPGRSRWYFATADGSLPWLELNDTDNKRMQSGEFAIVRTGPPGGHDYALLALPAAKRVAKVFEDRVAWWPPAAGRVATSG